LLQNARRLRREGRLEAAERTTRRGLDALEGSPPLHRLRAQLLAELGREEEALLHARRAEALDPPLPPLPAQAIDLPTRGLLVVLLPPPEDQRASGRAPTAWPEGEVHAVLSERLATRLPEARIVPVPPQEESTVHSLQSWLDEQDAGLVLSLRVDRAWCGETIKDGPFGFARLRVGVALRGEGARPARGDVMSAGEHHVPHIRHDAAPGRGCPARKTARALEHVFALQAFRTRLRRAGEETASARSSTAEWSRNEIHTLFPALATHIATHLGEGRRWLATNQLEAARAAFERATRIDPDDPDARSFVAEVDHTLELSRQLAERAGEPAASAVDEAAWSEIEPQLTTAQRRAIEEQLHAEQRLREDLLAILSLIDSEHALPDLEQLARLRRGTIHDPEAKGAQRARTLARASEDIRVRILHAPGGNLLARYYFEGESSAPLLVEQDSSGDGRLDRWTAYTDGVRSQTWEESRGENLPDVHIIYAPGGRETQRIELDESRDGRAERIFVYRDGRVRSESQDRDGDGRFEIISHFDVDGALVLREEDLNGDGKIDVRTTYRSGRMVKRSIMSPSVVDERP
jgi:tetratricopeptide (TPR) repeat protein